MNTRKLNGIESRIKRRKKALVTIGEMRPGSLTEQRRGETGSYYQLSYTHKMKGRTEYIRPEFVNDIKHQIAMYKRFRKLVDEWIELAIEHSKEKMGLAKRSGTK